MRAIPIELTGGGVVTATFTIGDGVTTGAGVLGASLPLTPWLLLDAQYLRAARSLGDMRSAVNWRVLLRL